MKYMMMTFGEAAEMFETKSTEVINGMIGVRHSFNAELRAAGELVDAQGLVDGREAKTIRTSGGTAVVTDGPFAEAKESLVGYWVLDVADEARALALGVDLANRLLALGEQSGPEDVLELRRIADGPPEA